MKFQLYELIETLDSGHTLAECLLFPELEILSGSPKRLQAACEERLGEILAKLPQFELHCRRLPEMPERGRMELELEPPRGQTLWQQPATLGFDYLHWRHGDEARLIVVPVLGITVLAPLQPPVFDELLARQVRFALARLQVGASLASLLPFNRVETLELRPLTIAPELPSLKQVAQARLQEAEAEESVLQQVAERLPTGDTPVAYEADDQIERLSETLNSPERTSVLLVGPSGVGKTALVHELARRWRRQPTVWTTGGSRLVAGASGFGMWQQRCQKLIREVHKKKAVLHLGNLVELIEVGKGGGSRQGIAAFLRPHLKRGQIVAIAECTREELAAIEQQEPQLLDAFQQFEVEEPSLARARSILLSAAIALQDRAHPAAEEAISLEGIETLDRLHRRYASYSAYPGRPLRFLTNLLRDRAARQTVGPAEVTSAFSRETGLPAFMLDAAQPLARAATQQWFASRVLGQPEPVQLVTDMLLTVKAGLTRAGRPIASFLFAGPTGVGKTEMAKALSEFMYGDRTRMVRFDMSEYADPLAIDRLIGGSFSTTGLLTRRVREQPFTVVLLDEFEKAHPNFYDILLQVLGEGRLTDSAGRVADFTNSILIMTSNLGADSYQEAPLGFASGQPSDAGEHFVRKVREFVRPEFFNRIDRIVPFAPLGREAIQAITLRELEQIRQRDGIRYRNIHLEVAPAVVDHLAARGYEPRYGARPLKRAVARTLLAPLADAVNQYSAELPLSAAVNVAAERLDVRVRAASGDASLVEERGRRHEQAAAVSRLRRQVQLLRASAGMRGLENQIFRLQMQYARAKKREEWSTKLAELERVLHPLVETQRRAEALTGLVEGLEDDAHLTAFQGRDLPGDVADRLTLAEEELRELTLVMYQRGEAAPNQLGMVLFSESLECLLRLTRAYLTVIGVLKGSCQTWALRLYRKDRVGSRYQLKARKATENEVPAEIADVFDAPSPSELLRDPPEDLLGIVLWVHAPYAFKRFEDEEGRHELNDRSGQGNCLVETFVGAISDYEPPAGIDRRGGQPQAELRRRYDFIEEQAVDPVLGRTWRLLESNPALCLTTVLSQAIEAHFQKNLLSWLGSWK